MKRLLVIILTAIVFCSCHSITGSGNIISETRNIGAFDGVNTSGSIDVELVNDNNSAVRVEADDNILPYIVTTINGGMLETHFKSGTFLNNVHAKVYASSPVIRSLSVSGSGSIISKDTLKNDGKIVMSIAGSGDIKTIIDAPAADAEIAGSGSISIAGRTRNLDCRGSGSGDFNCKNLLSENTNVNINGSGTAHVYASIRIIAKVNGSGDVYYSGNPPVHQFSGHGTFQQEK